MHASIELILKHPEESKNWHIQSNHLACLSVKDEETLLALGQKLEFFDIKYAIFREPDMDNQATAIAIEAHDKVKKICGHLPLALRELKT